jgi:predicted CoA-substrate-specific enzyme activase
VAGGVAQNAPFLLKLKALLGDVDLVVLEQSPYLEAFGAAHCASDLPAHTFSSRKKEAFRSKSLSFDVLKPLQDAESLLDYRVREKSDRRLSPGSDYILGVDAGSTTTKAVLFHVDNGTVDAGCYLRTHGNPVAATQECLRDLQAQLGVHEVHIVQMGVTGSGREMVSAFLDNCSSLNEILTHARAATEESPDVDTVFEIGGQDSKFISFLGGIPVDYAMNDGCSAGTGSFLEESASLDMQVPVTEISDKAKLSRLPLSFGERCAAFINTDIRDALQQGAESQDVLAGLVYSIAQNYMSRIVGNRSVGDHVLFQGGVALNRSVALAMAAKTGKKIVVPPHPELMGAVGTALMLRDRLRQGKLKTQESRLEALIAGDITMERTFTCASCENRCEIQRIGIRGKVYPFGGLCSKFENQRHGTVAKKEGRDLVAQRNILMFGTFGQQTLSMPRGKIGIPMALTAWDLFPFYAGLINELGYEVVQSEPCKEGNDQTAATVCYPCQIAHGAVVDLDLKGVDYFFLPYAIELDVPDGVPHGYTCPATTILPDILKKQFSQISGKFLSPHIAMRKDQIRTTLQEVADMARMLGIGREEAVKACERALLRYEEFKKSYRTMGDEELGQFLAEPTVILAGRPYTTCSSEVNLALPRKIASRGFNVVPADLLPPLGEADFGNTAWAFTQQVMNAVAYAKAYTNVHVCLVSCFSCGPDASTYHLVRQELSGHTFCYLEIDSHTAHAGVETRIGAFLDIIEERSLTNGHSDKSSSEKRSCL